MSMNIDARSEAGNGALHSSPQSPASASYKAQTDKQPQRRVTSAKIRKGDGKGKLEEEGQLPIVGQKILKPNADIESDKSQKEQDAQCQTDELGSPRSPVQRKKRIFVKKQ